MLYLLLYCVLAGQHLGCYSASYVDLAANCSLSQTLVSTLLMVDNADLQTIADLLHKTHTVGALVSVPVLLFCLGM